MTYFEKRLLAVSKYNINTTIDIANKLQLHLVVCTIVIVIVYRVFNHALFMIIKFMGIYFNICKDIQTFLPGKLFLNISIFN